MKGTRTRQNGPPPRPPSAKRAHGALGEVSLDSESRAPLYHQIYLILRDKILKGEYARGSHLPGERELGEIFNVSRITTVRALNELAASGLVVRSRGRGTLVQFVDTGTVVRGPAVKSGRAKAAPPDDESSAGSELDERSLARVTVHEFEYVFAPPAVEAALKLTAGQVVQYAVRTWRFDDKPFSCLASYVPKDIGAAWTRGDMAETPLGDLLKRSGVVIERTRERVTAILADAVAAERLNVPLNSPLLMITRTSYSAQARPVEYMIGLYPPDRYYYEVTAPRTRPEARAAVVLSAADQDRTDSPRS
jgi:GntR family transcriptional regulator